MKTISLTQDQVAMVDDEDFELLSQWKWYADWKESTQSFYAARKSRISEPFPPETTILMHRQAVSAPKGVDVDHHNGNTLDNRKTNLRLATSSQNGMNRRVGKNNTSGYKGVGWHKLNKTWEARIKVSGKLIHLGSFKTPEDAYVAYKQAALDRYGEFARV